MTAGPWEIRDRAPVNEVVAHEVVWTVLTGDDTEPVYCLRVAGHGQGAYDDDVLKVLLDPEMAEALVAQFVTETHPYLEGLL